MGESIGSATTTIDPFLELAVVEWDRADVNKDGSLDRKEITTLLRRLNLKVKKSEFKTVFEEIDIDGSGELNFTEFLAFLYYLRDRPEVNMIFVRYSLGEDTLSVGAFLNFLRTEQQEFTVTEDEAKEVMRHYEPEQESDENPTMGLSAFVQFLCSPDNDALSPHSKDVYQEMTHPLTHYFIASSHNTYCTGDQLTGESSVAAYIDAFLRGCRCVELDCWDGPDGEPLIYHGHTLTSRITFRSVVETIRDFGFVVSPYPVILSLENHCSIPQQEVMAQIMTEVLGDMLPPTFVGVHEEYCPSPESLKYKVLLKGKTLKRSAEETDDGDAGDDDSDGVESDEDDELSGGGGGGEEPAAKPAPLNRSRSWWRRNKKNNESTFSMESNASAGSAKGKAKKGGGKEEKVGVALSNMIHLRAVHFESFETSKTAAPYEMSSFSETKVDKMLKKNADEFLEYTRRQFARIYPKGTRFDSSNYDPQPAWCVGAQLVALNYQTPDKNVFMNEGLFLDNGRSGYVLKPEYMRIVNGWSPVPTALPTYSTHVLVVEVISARQLPKVEGADEKGDVIDPYVALQVCGMPQDRRQARTRTIQNNGFNPVWNETFDFPITHMDLAVLVVRVADAETVSGDRFVGYAAMPVRLLREGYRSVFLRDQNHQVLPIVNLLVNIKLVH